MEEMYRLDFSRGTVEKIDSRIPPRGWQDASADSGREASPRRAGNSAMAQETAASEKRDED